MDPEIEGRGDGTEHVPGRVARGAAVAVILPFYLAWDVARRLTRAVARALESALRMLISGLLRLPPLLGSALEPAALVIDRLVSAIVASVASVTSAVGWAIRTLSRPIRWTIRAAATAVEKVRTAIGRVVKAAIEPIQRAAEIIVSAIGSLLGSVEQAIRRGIGLIERRLAPVFSAIAVLARASLSALRDVGRWAWAATVALGRGCRWVLGRLADMVSGIGRAVATVAAWVARVVGPPTMRMVDAVVSVIRHMASVIARGIRRVWLSASAMVSWIAGHIIAPVVAGLVRVIGPVIRQVRVATHVARETVRLHVTGPVRRELRAMAAAVRSTLETAARARADAVAVIRARFARRGAR